MPGRGLELAAWVVVTSGFAGAVATVLALHRSVPSEPNLIVGGLIFIPYVAAAMLLQITRKARLVLVALLVPAILDVSFGAWFNFVDPPAWDAALAWRAARGLTGVFILPAALAAGLWMERADRR